VLFRCGLREAFGDAVQALARFFGDVGADGARGTARGTRRPGWKGADPPMEPDRRAVQGALFGQAFHSGP